MPENVDQYVNTIICGDNMKVMPDLPDGCIDLTVTSPPYDNLRDYKGYSFNFEGIAKQLYRITKVGGVVVWIVGDMTVNGSETGTSFKQALYFKKIGFNLHDTMIYEKSGCSFPETNRYYPIAEYMFVLSKGSPKTTNLISDRINTYAGEYVARENADRQKDGSLTPNTAYKNEYNKKVKQFGVRYNIWKYSVGKGNTTKDDVFAHPAIFPEKLAADHILSWSNPGDIILDPMSGSGTTVKMASLLGRRYIGIDISSNYCEIARQRLESVDTGVSVKEIKAGQLPMFPVDK